MTISVVDTSTGQALSVREVAAEIDRQEAEIRIDRRADLARRDVAVDHMDAEAVAWRDLQKWARNVLNGHAVWHEQIELVSEPAVFADLPPDPALQLAPERLDAEHAQAMAIQAERRHRMAALAPIGQRFVPEVPSETLLLPRKISDDEAEEIKQRWIERYARRVEVIRRQPWSRRVKTWASGWAEWLKPSGGESDDR